MEADKPYPRVSLWQCQDCTHKYASPIINPDKLTEYYFKVDSVFYNRNDQTLVDSLATEHRKTFDEVNAFLKPGRVLEIGCGQGHLLHLFAENGWETHGVEPSSSASAFARDTLGVPVKTEFLTKETYNSDSFDLIMLFDVVEHLTSMDELMSLFKHYLKPDGMLVIGTGNINSATAKINGKTWAYFSGWEHVSFFSPESAEFLLTKHGFQLKKISRHSHKGAPLTNARNFILNLAFFKPLNVVLPGLFVVFPFLKRAPGISHRSMAETGVVTSKQAFDHFTIYANLDSSD